MQGDELLAARIDGADLGEVWTFTGHGPGPTSADSEASRRGPVFGEMRTTMRNMVSAALGRGWTITTIDCEGGDYLAYGAKIIDGFGARLALQVYTPTGGGPTALVQLTAPPAAEMDESTLSPKLQHLGLEGSCLDDG